MHELGIVFHIIRTLEASAKENNLKEISSVTLEIGEVSGVMEHYLKDCWKWAVGRTDLLKHASLQIETLPAVTYCEACTKTYPTVQHGRICPYCGSEKTYLLHGNEFLIKEITAI